MPPKTRTQKISPNDDHFSDEGQAIIDLIELKLDMMKKEILQEIDEKDEKIYDLERKVHSLERQNGDLLMSRVVTFCICRKNMHMQGKNASAYRAAQENECT